MVYYSRIETKIMHLIPWIKEQISKSSDNIIRIKVEDIEKVVGNLEKYSEKIKGVKDVSCKKCSENELYWILKSVLYEYGISLETGKTKNDEALFLMKSFKEVTLPPDIIKLKVEPKIPIISPTEVPSSEKRFFISIIERIEELELPAGQNTTVFNIMITGAKFAIDQNTEVEDLLTYYHADERIYYFFGIADAMERYGEINDFIKTFSSSEEEFKLYFDLYVSGISLISEIYESGESIPYMKKIIEDLDSIMDEDEISDPKFTWQEVKDYIYRIE